MHVVGWFKGLSGDDCRRRVGMYAAELFLEIWYYPKYVALFSPGCVKIVV